MNDCCFSIEIIKPLVPTIEVAAPGPQGPPGPAGSGDTLVGALPTGGAVGSLLIKTGNADYAADWTPFVDGGTFN